MEENIVVSNLNKTWIFDLDGTICIHNGYKMKSGDVLLQGAKEFFVNIDKDDMIIFVTSRKEETKLETEEFLKKNNIRYDHIIYNAPYGERILINDMKPSGLKTSISINTKRDEFMKNIFVKDDNL